MTLRDLTNDELDELRGYCDVDFLDFTRRTHFERRADFPNPTDLGIWRAGYSACLKRILGKNEKET